MLDKGYQCELQGKGIGAFAYYRRFLEFRTKELLQRTRSIATITNCPPELIARLDEGIKTDQYKRALEVAKEALPGTLITGGVNPFLVLHQMVSGDLHKGSDAECLEHATETRLLLECLAGIMESMISHDEAIRVALDKAKERTSGRIPKTDGDVPPDGNGADKIGP